MDLNKNDKIQLAVFYSLGVLILAAIGGLGFIIVKGLDKLFVVIREFMSFSMLG